MWYSGLDMCVFFLFFIHVNKINTIMAPLICSMFAKFLSTSIFSFDSSRGMAPVRILFLSLAFSGLIYFSFAGCEYAMDFAKKKLSIPSKQSLSIVIRVYK